MSKVVESIFKDAMDKVKTPEFHASFIAPLFAYILDFFFPYIVAIVGLWVAMLLGIVFIIVLLIRGKTITGIQ